MLLAASDAGERPQLKARLKGRFSSQRRAAPAWAAAGAATARALGTAGRACRLTCRRLHGPAWRLPLDVADVGESKEGEAEEDCGWCGREGSTWMDRFFMVQERRNAWCYQWPTQQVHLKEAVSSDARNFRSAIAHAHPRYKHGPPPHHPEPLHQPQTRP